MLCSALRPSAAHDCQAQGAVRPTLVSIAVPYAEPLPGRLQAVGSTPTQGVPRARPDRTDRKGWTYRYSLLSFVVMKQSTANALAPLEFILRVATGLILLVLVGQFLIALSGGQATGKDGAVCVDSPVDAMTATHGQRLAKVQPLRSGTMLKPGVEATATTVRLCDSSP